MIDIGLFNFLQILEWYHKYIRTRLYHETFPTQILYFRSLWNCLQINFDIVYLYNFNFNFNSHFINFRYKKWSHGACLLWLPWKSNIRVRTDPSILWNKKGTSIRSDTMKPLRQPTGQRQSNARMQQKLARKGFRPPSAMKGIGYFQNLRIFLKNC